MIGGLTKKQYEAYRFIETFCRENGWSPSYEEMMRGLNISSKSGVFRLIHSLKERGFIDFRESRSRSIYLKQQYCKRCGVLIEQEEKERWGEG